jgi:hypothetical protein
MERGYNLVYCPTCELGIAQREANDIAKQGIPHQPGGAPELLGMLVGIAIVGYFLYWLFS